MKEQTGIKRGAVHRKFVLAAHPIIEDYIERLRIREIIENHIMQDQRLTLSSEKIIGIMIHNILTTPKPMYELHDWCIPLAEEAVGLELGDVDSVTDDRAGKVLDRFYAGKHKEVFFRLALRAIKCFELDCSRIHQDTTTVTFAGSYRTWSARELLTHGHNKDHRPDLKQLVLGISATEDGSVPLEHRIYDGNQTDDTLHVDTHKRLRKLLQRSDFIYVADCKLATADNLRKISSCGGRFISVMPRTWKEDKQFRKQVRLGNVIWRHLLSRKNNRQPGSKIDRYYLARGEYSTSAGYGLLWIKSTQKAEQDTETRTRHIEKALEALRSLQGRLNKYKLKTRSAINNAVLDILTANQCKKYLTFHVHRHTVHTTRFKKPGRPRRGEKGQKVSNSYFSLSFALNQDQLNTAKLLDGIFPLITNVHEDYKPKKILEIYKFQPFLEKRHSQIKTYQQIAPSYLKKGKRVVALLHVHVLALAVATLIERQLRRAMIQRDIATLPIYPGGLPCKYPTMFDLARLFEDVERYEVQVDDELTVFPAQLSKTQKQVLDMLDVPPSRYQ